MTIQPISISAPEQTKLVDLARSSGLTYLAVFGSVARGEAGPESDVDLAVRFGRRMTLFDLADLQSRFQEILQKPVDLIPMDNVYPFMLESLGRDQIVLLDAMAEAVA